MRLMQNWLTFAKTAISWRRPPWLHRWMLGPAQWSRFDRLNALLQQRSRRQRWCGLRSSWWGVRV